MSSLVETVEKAGEPIALFRQWLSEAEALEPNDPNALALATATPDGTPSVRMVLLKGLDDRGFAFYTSAQSRKGLELAENPRAAMCFHWKSLRRQGRIEGLVSDLPSAEVDAYFHSRSRDSQIGAVASRQSRRLASRELLDERVEAVQRQYPGRIARPDFWCGYVLWPQRIEFWINGADRLHDRFLFVRQENGWLKERLYP